MLAGGEEEKEEECHRQQPYIHILQLLNGCYAGNFRLICAGERRGGAAGGRGGGVRVVTAHGR